MKFFKKYFQLMGKKLDSVDYDLFLNAIELVEKVRDNNSKIIFAGNGGSAAMSSHLTVDMTKVGKVRSINFNEADLLTCFSNDYGYENVYEKAIEFYGDPGDLAILISSSGKSQNMVNAANKAIEMGLNVVTFTGFDSNNPLKKLGDVNFWVDCKAYNIVEMTHHVWLLSIVDYLAGDIYYAAN
jgi:D-sedoheptulose 7-phosphate isomerase